MEQAQRIFLVEDHPLTSTGIKSVLRHDSQCSIVAVAGSFRNALECLKTLQADVAMLDITLPDGSGMTLIEPCLKRGMKVIILSMHLDAEVIFESFRRGALCYVSKLSRPETLLQALRCVSNSRSYVCGLTADVLLDFERQRSLRMKFPQLTRRESVVAAYIAAGVPTTEIAERLHLSTRTIDSHRLSIFRKLGVVSALQLARITTAAQCAV
ncbi:MAG: response regulator [Spirochaetaceae bacterium]